MSNWLLTPAARDDIFAIWSYIANRDLRAADRVEAELLEACADIAKQPDLGHWRHDLTSKPVRFFTVRATYMIAYDPATNPLEIMRIIHAARDVKAEL